MEEETNITAVGQQLNKSVQSVLVGDKLEGFEKAFQIAQAMEELDGLLTPQYMAPIMKLQGNKLGFKTDKDSSGGYVEYVVRNCLKEAVLTGVQPFGNQFNIIASNCYITKEGFGYLLKNMKGLQYEIIPALPRINADKTSAAIEMKITWTYNGPSQERSIDFPIRMNSSMGTDAVIGKAMRKARAWLYNNLNNTEIADGDIMDIEAEVLSSKPNAKERAGDAISSIEGKLLNKDDLSATGAKKMPQSKEFEDAKIEEPLSGTLEVGSTITATTSENPLAVWEDLYGHPGERSAAQITLLTQIFSKFTDGNMVAAYDKGGVKMYLDREDFMKDSTIEEIISVKSVLKIK